MRVQVSPPVIKLFFLIFKFLRKIFQFVIFLNLIEFKLHSRGAPSIQQIKESRKLFKQIEYPVLIHCKSGADRTGLMATLYLIFKGIDIKTAKSQLSFRYLHVRLAKSGILDNFFDNYVHYLSNSGKLSFWEWSEKIYSPEELKKNFNSCFYSLNDQNLKKQEKENLVI